MVCASLSPTTYKRSYKPVCPWLFEEYYLGKAIPLDEAVKHPTLTINLPSVDARSEAQTLDGEESRSKIARAASFPFIPLSAP